MSQPQEEKKLAISSQEDRCSYEKCQSCIIIKHCETCYNETCYFEHCNQFCGRCPVTCHSSPDGEFEEVDLDSLQFNGPTQQLNFAPGWFPTIRKNNLIKKIELPAVFVKFEEIFNFKSGLMREFDLHEYFELPKETRIILTFNIPDRILEKIWLTFRNSTFKLITKGLKVDYVCAPNFSNYFDTPRYQYWRNMWRSILMANELQDLGYKLILDISSPVPATHRYYLDLIQRSKAQAICFNCQTVKLNRYKRLVYERLKVMDKLPKSVDFIITGMCSEKDARPVYEICKGRRLYYTSTSPYLKAVCGCGMDGRTRMNLDRSVLMKTYFKMFQDIHKGLADEYSSKHS